MPEDDKVLPMRPGTNYIGELTPPMQAAWDSLVSELAERNRKIAALMAWKNAAIPFLHILRDVDDRTVGGLGCIDEYAWDRLKWLVPTDDDRQERADGRGAQS